MRRINRKLHKDYNIAKVWGNIEPKYKYTLLFTVVIGFLTHGMALFHKFAMHDEAAYYLYTSGMSDWWTTGGTYKAGRWMLGIIGQLTGLLLGDNISTCSFAGLISIVLLAVSACVLISALEIQNIVIAVLFGILMVTCPIIVGLFGFMYIAPQYLLGLLMGFVGANFICKDRSKGKWIVGIVLASASVGVYQAFIPNIICVFLFCFIRDNCVQSNNAEKTVKEMAYYASSAVAFMLLYFVINKLFLIYYGFELIQYKGINSMLDFSHIMLRFKNAFFNFFFPKKSISDVIYPQNIRYVYYLLILFWGITSLYFLYAKYFKEKTLYRLIISAISYLLIPFSVSFIYLMCDEKYIVGHMAYGQIMFFVYILFVTDIMLYSETKIFDRNILKFIVVVICIVCVYYMRFDNVTYIKAEIGQERMVNWSNTLVTRIKSVKGYDDDYPVMYIGMNQIEDKSMRNLNEFEFIVDTPYYGVETLISDYALQRFIAIWTGFDPEINYDVNRIIDEEQYKIMPCYPDDGSIAVINGNVVVKFSN